MKFRPNSSQGMLPFPDGLGPDSGKRKRPFSGTLGATPERDGPFAASAESVYALSPPRTRVKRQAQLAFPFDKTGNEEDAKSPPGVAEEVGSGPNPFGVLARIDKHGLSAGGRKRKAGLDRRRRL